MASTSSISKKVITPVCRLAYPYIFQPDEKGKYRAVLLFDKTTFNANFMNEIVAEVKSQLQMSTYKQGFPAQFRLNPLKDGDVPNGMGNTPFKGYFYCNVGSQFQPGVVGPFADPSKRKPDGSAVPMIINDPNEIYGGVYVRAQIHAYSYNAQGNCGIALSIDGLQKIKDGEKLGGGGDVQNAFDCPSDAEIADSQGVLNNVDVMNI